MITAIDDATELPPVAVTHEMSVQRENERLRFRRTRTEKSAPATAPPPPPTAGAAWRSLARRRSPSLPQFNVDFGGETTLREEQWLCFEVKENQEILG